jgi:hypothetical protein
MERRRKTERPVREIRTGRGVSEPRVTYRRGNASIEASPGGRRP